MSYARIPKGALGDPRVTVGAGQRTYLVDPAMASRYSTRQLLEYFRVGDCGGSVKREANWTAVVIRTA